MNKPLLRPSFEEGRTRRSRKMQRYLSSAWPGRAYSRRGRVTDLPGCALAKVALHFVYRAQPPFLGGGAEKRTSD
jgi:hypothetical protein